MVCLLVNGPYLNPLTAV